MSSRKRKVKAAGAPTPKPGPAPSNRRRLVLLTALVVALLGVAVFWWTRHWAAKPVEPTRLPPAEDPRLTIATPFLNVRPQVQYVGDDACAGCHDTEAKTYHEHPMSRSLAPIASATPVERFEAESRNPFETLGLLYRVEKRAGRVVHKESSAAAGIETEADIAFAVGSGRRGRSYLIEHDGYLFQSPITWYPLKGIWDLSPGYRESNAHFNRAIVPTCLFCHANQVEPDPETVNRFKPPLFRGHAIGCERCHGPGELHVQRHRSGDEPAGIDYTIVNPRHLEHALREAICQQCHLHGEARVLPRGREYFDFRPGLPLHLFVADFVRPADQRLDNTFVGTVEQMYASRCFQQSSGDDKMGCISCHDPHSKPTADDRVAFYRGRCLQCHAKKAKACNLPRPERLQKSPEDSCIVCHMPTRSGSVVHTAITDHAIPRRGEAAAAPKADDWPRQGQMPLVPFPLQLRGVKDNDQDRNLGLALMQLALQHGGDSQGPWLAQLATPYLETAAAGDPEDAVVWEAKATILVVEGRPKEALAACVAALQIHPRRETLLYMAANLANQLQRPAEARGYAERALKVNPWLWQCHYLLAAAYAQEGDWDKAAAACRQALKFEPTNMPSRQLLLRYYLQRGEKAQAQRERDVCLALLPADQQDAFRHWFEQQVR
jgi:hypothetical protein